MKHTLQQLHQIAQGIANRIGNISADLLIKIHNMISKEVGDVETLVERKEVKLDEKADQNGKKEASNGKADEAENG